MDGSDVANPLTQLAADLKALTERVEGLAGQVVPPAPTGEPTPAEKVWQDLEPGIKWGIENGQIDPAHLSADLQAVVAELGKAPTEPATQQAPPVA